MKYEPGNTKHYWFKPKRFWRWFAAYYPVSKEGMLITALALFLLGYVFIDTDRMSHSVSDTFYAFAPKVLLVLIAFDAVTRWRGEYPRWWKKK